VLFEVCNLFSVEWNVTIIDKSELRRARGSGIFLFPEIAFEEGKLNIPRLKFIMSSSSIPFSLAVCRVRIPSAGKIF
jgi:hypothetical protein